jgi:hypothetical protein
VATASTPGKPHSDACGVELGINYSTKHAMQWGIVTRLQNTSEKQQTVGVEKPYENGS